MIILKIFRPDEWQAFEAAGETLGAPIDLLDGYIHFSTPEQAAETAAKHFHGAGDLVLAAVDADRLGETLKWEVSRGDALFPHLYRALELSDVIWTRSMPMNADGGHDLPSLE